MEGMLMAEGIRISYPMFDRGGWVSSLIFFTKKMPSKRRKKHHPAVNLSLVTPKQRQKTPDVEPNPTPTTIKIDTTKNQIKTFHKNSKLAVPVHQPTLQTLRTAPLKSILKKPVQLPPTTPPPSTTPEAPVTTPCNRKKKRKPKKKKKKPAKIINSSRFSFYQTDTALCVDIYEPNVSALDVIFLPNHVTSPKKLPIIIQFE